MRQCVTFLREKEREGHHFISTQKLNANSIHKSSSTYLIDYIITQLICKFMSINTILYKGVSVVCVYRGVQAGLFTSNVCGRKERLVTMASSPWTFVIRLANSNEKYEINIPFPHVRKSTFAICRYSALYILYTETFYCRIEKLDTREGSRFA